MQMEKVPCTSDAAGNTIVAYTPNKISGLIHSIYYDGAFDNTADFSISAEDSARAIWAEANLASAAITKSPRIGTHNTVGVAQLYAAGGSTVNDRIPIYNERVKFSITQPGNSKTSVFLIFYE